MAYNYIEQCERKVVLDTETTGKEEDGTPGSHRIIEIGCVELMGRRLTGRKLQLYINPERAVDEEAFRVHNISNEFLSDKPKFIEIFHEFYEFIKGSELIIHNAKFDVGFINNEFKLHNKNLKVENIAKVSDTLEIARHKFPGQRISLDALCSKLGVDSSARTSHGALLDAEILAEVYLAMTESQATLDFGDDENEESSYVFERSKVLGDKKLRVIKAQGIEYADHLKYIMHLSNFSSSIGFGEEFLVSKPEGSKKIREEDVMNRLKNDFLTEQEYQDYLKVLEIRATDKKEHELSGVVDYKLGAVDEYKSN